MIFEKSNLNLVRIDSTNFIDYADYFQKIAHAADLDPKSKKENYVWNDWENNVHSFGHALGVEKRFDPPTGFFHLIHNQIEPIACSGCYQSDWSKEVWIGGVRTWTHPNFRKDWWHGKHLLPLESEEALQCGAKAFVLTFNQSSTNLWSFLRRISMSQAVSLGSKAADFYKDLIFLDDDFVIRNTQQKIAVRLFSLSKEEFLKNHLPKRCTYDSSLGAY